MDLLELSCLIDDFRVQKIIDGYQSKPHKTKAKPFVLKGMITCAYCGCVVTPEIKKKRYVYYSCTNGKGGCKRTYVREERLLKPLMEYFDHISLSEKQIQTDNHGIFERDSPF